MRMIGIFEKSPRLRHIGHLDIQRAVQRALRRSGLPVAYSKGFNPHILVTFASALATGASGDREIMDVTMESQVSEEEFLTAMNRAMPADMQLSAARALDDKHPALMAILTAAAYRITIRDEAAAKRMINAIPAFLAREEIMAVRKTKTGMKDTNIKPLIYALTGEGNILNATLALTERETCKPSMLTEALSRFTGDETPEILVHRTGLFGLDQDGRLRELETL